MPSRRTRIAMSLRIQRELAERVRAFCRDNAGVPLRLSISTFAEEAFQNHLAELERRLAGREDPRRLPPSRNSTLRL